MSTTSRCHLTAKDFSILEVILQSGVNNDEAYLRLLRRKLSTATVLFQDDIDPQVATIDSLVDFTIDGRLSENRILVNESKEASTGMTLPITTLRGLALLGLTAGDAIVVERADGGHEEIRLNMVTFQPEADRRERSLQQADAETASDRQPTVISFAARKKTSARMPIEGPFDPDDDPGPRAA